MDNLENKNRQCMKSFYNHKRHYFIMTQSGKPIFTKYGDQNELSSFFAGLSVIIQKYSQFCSQQNEESFLQTLVFPDQKIYFAHKQQLIFICISKIQNESEYLIRKALDFMDLQIISMITDQIYKRLELRSNFDPSHLIQGSERQIIQTLKNATNYFPILMDAYYSFPLNKHARERIFEIFKQNQNFEPLYQILMTPFNIISYQKSKKIKGSYQDFQILLNWMQIQSQLRKEQNWIPICLPGISQEGYVYAYTNFISQNVGLIIISDDNSKEMFHNFTTQAEQITKQLNDYGLLEQINEQCDQNPLFEILEIPYCKQIVIKNLENSQLYVHQKHQIKVDFETKSSVRQFANIYNQYLQLNQNKKEFINYEKNQVFFQILKDQIICLYANSEYCILLSFGNFINVDDMNQIIFNVLKQIKEEQFNCFFQ